MLPDSHLPLQTIFWASVFIVLYTYLIYPVLLIAISSLRQALGDIRYAASTRERRRRLGRSAEELPAVSVVFAAYNEEAVMAEKMANCAAIDYPREKIEFLAGCDGCSDRTVEIATAGAPPGARVLDLRPRSGKPSVLNRVTPMAAGEIVVLSDANTMFDPGAIRALVRHFADPSVGCVCGELRLLSPDGTPKPEGLYWRYEVFLKFFEGRMNMLLGANGGVFAIRRELFQPLPKNAIIDDFLIAMNIIQQGYRSVYDREAVGYEEAAASVQHEFHRRTRIGAGNYHALRYTWRLLLPWAGWICFSYWSHKVFRWLAPFALAAGFASAVALAWHPFYAVCAAAGVAGALLALLGYRMELRRAPRAIFSIPYYFLSMNLALFLGFIRFLTGGQSTVWRRTAREKKA